MPHSEESTGFCTTEFRDAVELVHKLDVTRRVESKHAVAVGSAAVEISVAGLDKWTQGVRRIAWNTDLKSGHSGRESGEKTEKEEQLKKDGSFDDAADHLREDRVTVSPRLLRLGHRLLARRRDSRWFCACETRPCVGYSDLLRPF